ncbi:hypothetical protein HYU17_04475 [Candidatus Woesearchaeota archaeon]|nr:hypothetical protein [Candidatus Woesearchaeota archaeon]
MADAKRGLLQSIMQAIPVLGVKKEEEGLPAKGPLPVHMPKAAPYSTRQGWYTHRIKYKGMFDLDGFYKTMALWFKERRFELHEKLYKSKPPELRIEWEAERKRTSFVKELVFVYVHMWGDYNVEVIQNGRKKKMANVRMIVTVDGDIEAPYADIFGQKRWTATNIERRILRVFQRWIILREVQGLYWDRLYYELYDLYGTLKEFLKFGAR